MAGEHLDLSSEPPRSAPTSNSAGGERVSASSAGRRFVGVQFDCCAVYARIYINRDGDAYEGRCPRCARAIRLEIGPGGTSSRFFVAR